ncbi:MAG: transporter [Gammaproteobacteria bacterium]|nr:transporter [Gammaproteobacteria bacterium]
MLTRSKCGLWIAAFVALVLSWSMPSVAQDLEPRRWSHLPAGLNVIGLATGWADGDILLDPVLLAEDVEFDLYFTGVGYARAFDFGGRTARIDLTVPYATGRWEGIVDGEYTTTRRRGFTDPKVRFSVNLYGAPALSGSEYVRFRQENPVNTTVGAAVAITFPLGYYDNTKLINISGNRMVYRPQLGILHQRRNWQFELTGSVLIYGSNNDFWNGNTLKQDPLWFAQGHVIYAFKPGWWASLSGGYGYGGRSDVNGVEKGDDRRQRFLALSFGMPINRQQSVKITYLASDTHIDLGADSRTLLLGWSYNWGP